ncbi:MAG: hypothetical protein Q7T73_02640 [Beijerinckiaceae bacterium]|nr:hypothetical protein [Beijerinckiaceae bacterium]
MSLAVMPIRSVFSAAAGSARPRFAPSAVSNAMHVNRLAEIIFHPLKIKYFEDADSLKKMALVTRSMLRHGSCAMGSELPSKRTSIDSWLAIYA